MLNIFASLGIWLLIVFVAFFVCWAVYEIYNLFADWSYAMKRKIKQKKYKPHTKLLKKLRKRYRRSVQVRCINLHEDSKVVRVCLGCNKSFDTISDSTRVWLEFSSDCSQSKIDKIIQDGVDRLVDVHIMRVLKDRWDKNFQRYDRQIINRFRSWKWLVRKINWEVYGSI